MELEQSQLKKIVCILNYFIKLESLENRYKVKIPDLPDFCENTSFNQKEDYTSNVNLKKVLSEKFNTLEQEKKERLADWIISDWGGIPKLRKTTKRKEKVLEILKNSSSKPKIKEIVLELKLPDSISTISKILSFISPEEYAICDARVIFSLNWLLFLSREDSFIQFYELSTRNTILKSYNILFLLNKLNLLSVKKETEYLQYLNVMNQISAELKKSFTEWELYDTEMLLFVLANDLEKGFPFLIRELILNITENSLIDKKMKEFLDCNNWSNSCLSR